jgi:hypothetical protein
MHFVQHQASDHEPIRDKNSWKPANHGGPPVVHSPTKCLTTVTVLLKITAPIAALICSLLTNLVARGAEFILFWPLWSTQTQVIGCYSLSISVLYRRIDPRRSRRVTLRSRYLLFYRDPTSWNLLFLSHDLDKSTNYCRTQRSPIMESVLGICCCFTIILKHCGWKKFPPTFSLCLWFRKPGMDGMAGCPSPGISGEIPVRCHSELSASWWSLDNLPLFVPHSQGWQIVLVAGVRPQPFPHGQGASHMVASILSSLDLTWTSGQRRW